MKIPLLLAQYLLQKKALILQGIGEFRVDQFYENPFEKDKSKQELPENTIHFIADKKAKEDPELIDFIAKHTGKIKPLASADLDSFLVLGKQLLNISKPFAIEGLGTLQMDAHNEIEFLQGHVHLHKKEEAGLRKQKHSHAEDDGVVSFEENYLKPPPKSEITGRKMMIMGLLLAGLAIMAWVGYYFYSTAKQKAEPRKEIDIKPANQNNVPVDSSQIKKDSTITPSNTSPGTSTAQLANQSTFKVVLEIAHRKRALKRYADLIEWGYKVVMTTTDSVSFKIALPIQAPLKDTSRYRDSLSRYFARKVWIEI